MASFKIRTRMPQQRFLCALYNTSHHPRVERREIQSNLVIDAHFRWFSRPAIVANELGGRVLDRCDEWYALLLPRAQAIKRMAADETHTLLAAHVFLALFIFSHPKKNNRTHMLPPDLCKFPWWLYWWRTWLVLIEKYHELGGGGLVVEDTYSFVAGQEEAQTYL